MMVWHRSGWTLSITRTLKLNIEFLCFQTLEDTNRRQVPIKLNNSRSGSKLSTLKWNVHFTQRSGDSSEYGCLPRQHHNLHQILLDRDAQTTGVRSPGLQNWWVVSMENTLHYLLGPRILRWLLDFEKLADPRSRLPSIWTGIHINK
jgi:hypothetical protein